MKKALIVSPYLDHLGGGERYMLSVASVLESLGHEIYFAWDNLEEIMQLSTMLGIDLRSPRLDPKIRNLYIEHRPLAMYAATRPYDVVVYLSDGSIPLLGGKCNILHMQVPFHGVGGSRWKNKLKKAFIHHVIVNSRFTKRIVDKEYGINSTIIFPPVVAVDCHETKENIILSVGRFEPSLNAKKQNILVEAWRKLSPQLPGWELILAGATFSDDWVAKLRQLGNGLPIRFEVNVSYKKLCKLYAVSRIYWHAAGHGVDEAHNPELTEHFGISTIEAIMAGAVPLVVGKGGQIEIVKSKDLQWDTIEELSEKTLKVINSPNISEYLDNLSVSEYRMENFAENIKRLLK